MKTQTGLIFKPEKPRVVKGEYLAQYLERQASIAGLVHAMSADAEFEKADSPWIELRDTITNYPVRYSKGRAIQARLGAPASHLFKWQTKRQFTDRTVARHGITYFRREFK